MSLGTLPGGSALAGLPQSEGGGGSSREEGEMSAAQLAMQASSLMALLTSRAALDAMSKSSKIWLGEGLGSIPKRMYNRMMKWEFIDMGELRLRTAVEKSMLEPDTQKVVVLPGQRRYLSFCRKSNSNHCQRTRCVSSLRTSQMRACNTHQSRAVFQLYEGCR